MKNGEASAGSISKLLLAVSIELTHTAQLVDGPATLVRIEGQDARISRLVEELSKNEWMHLACDGVLDTRQVFESTFVMYDGRFTIGQVIQCDPEFAYLSPCRTPAEDESPDKAIYLASTMQFARFRSVIGTMWPEDDADTKKVTQAFYKHMVDGLGRLDRTRVVAALRRTMKSVDMPIDQCMSYVHLGA